MARSHFDFAILNLGFDIKRINVRKAELANIEGLITKIDYQPTMVYRLHVGTNILPVKTEAALGIYKLGSTAIASKEFGFKIDSSTVLQPEINLGINLGQFEFWLKTSMIFSVKDEAENFYKAPYYYPDYLMAKRTAFLEIRWLF